MKKIISIFIVITLMCSVGIVSALATDNEDLNNIVEFCKDVYLTQCLGKATDDEVRDNVQIEVYGTADEFYVFRGCHNGARDAFCEKKLGNYIFGWYETYSISNEIGLYIANGQGNLWTIAEAFDENIIDLCAVAAIVPYAYRIGDADYDGEINIKDATTIQKLIAGLEFPQRNICISQPEDIDLDGEVTIKDATAIQKHIAGLSY